MVFEPRFKVPEADPGPPVEFRLTRGGKASGPAASARLIRLSKLEDCELFRDIFRWFGVHVKLSERLVLALGLGDLCDPVMLSSSSGSSSFSTSRFMTMEMMMKMKIKIPATHPIMILMRLLSTNLKKYDTS